MKQVTLRDCQSRLASTGKRCPAQALWQVRVGTRDADSQLACDRHLHLACRAMYEAEYPRKPVLTVIALPAVALP